MINASVYIITKNEETNIRRCLNSIKDFAEVIVVDSGSKDNTLKIAAEFDNVQIIHQDWLGFAKQKQFALEQCTCNWVLNLDADEEISGDAVKHIASIINNNSNVDGLEFKMYNYFCGKRPHPLSKSMRKIRFARRLRVKYNTDVNVHESMIVEGKVSLAQGCIYHYGESSIKVLVDKINNYSSLRAKKITMPGGILCIIATINFVLAFVKSYILQRNFLNGSRGFAGSFILAFYAFLKKIKSLDKSTLEQQSAESSQIEY